VAAAGIYVELWIASISALIWLNAHDGLIKTSAGYFVLICSVGTILVNSNPCFRYDGYYILSDMWGVPNLATQSNRAFWQVLISILGGRKPKSADFDAGILPLSVFAVVSFIYRIAILGLIMWLTWITLVPNGFGFLAVLIIVVTSLGLLLMVWRTGVKIASAFFYSPPIKILRLATLLLIISSIGVSVVYLPLAESLLVRGTLDFSDKVPIYASETATIKTIGSLERQLRSGEQLFELESQEKTLEEMKIDSNLASLITRRDSLKRSSVSERSASYELPGVLELIDEHNKKLTILTHELENLKGLAPFQGYFIKLTGPIPPSIASACDTTGVQPLLDDSRLGSIVERGTMLGWFATKEKNVVQAIVPESDVKSLRPGMEAQCMFDSSAGRSLRGRITRISPEPVIEVPLNLLGDSQTVVVRTSEGRLQPETPHYQVTVSIDDTESLHEPLGAIATVRFDLPRSSIASRVFRYVSRSFRRRD